MEKIVLIPGDHPLNSCGASIILAGNLLYAGSPCCEVALMASGPSLSACVGCGKKFSLAASSIYEYAIGLAIRKKDGPDIPAWIWYWTGIDQKIEVDIQWNS